MIAEALATIAISSLQKGTRAHKYKSRKRVGNRWVYDYGDTKYHDVKVHPRIGGGTHRFYVIDVGKGRVRLSRQKDGSYGPTMPKASLSHFINDLAGRVVLPKSGHPKIDAVIRGDAKFLGKGDDGLVFKVGDSVVKVSTTVPFQPENPGHRSPKEAVAMLKGQAAVGNTLADAGIAGVQRSQFIEHGDKGFQIKAFVEIPEKFTRAQLDVVQDTLIEIHKAGYSVNDDIQVGLDKGKPVMFDVGKAAKIPEGEDPESMYSRVTTDMEAMKWLYAEHGQEFVRRDYSEGQRDMDRVDARFEKWMKINPKFAHRHLTAAIEKRAKELKATLSEKKLDAALDSLDLDLGFQRMDLEAAGLPVPHYGPKAGKTRKGALALMLSADLRKAGPFIGPRGGKWADPKFKIPWRGGMVTPRRAPQAHPAVQAITRAAKEYAAHGPREHRAFAQKLTKLSPQVKQKLARTFVASKKMGSAGESARLFLAEHGLSRGPTGVLDAIMYRAAMSMQKSQEFQRNVEAYEKVMAGLGVGVLGSGLFKALKASGLELVPFTHAGAAEPAVLVKALVVLPKDRIRRLYEAGLSIVKAYGQTPEQTAKKMVEQHGSPAAARKVIQETAAYAGSKEHWAKVLEHVPKNGAKAKAGGPFVGPRGGKWADAKHTIPWKEGAPTKAKVVQKEPRKVLRHMTYESLKANLSKLKAVAKEEGSGKLRAPHHTVSGQGLVNEAKLAEGGLMVLDEFHSFSPVAVDQLVRELKRPGAPKVKLAITSRPTETSEYGRGHFPSRPSDWKAMLRFKQRSYDRLRGQLLGQAAKSELLIFDLRKAGPFIGPKGGKWADPKFTIAWKETKGRQPGKKEEEGKPRPGKKEAAPGEKVPAAAEEKSPTQRAEQILQAAIDSGKVKGSVQTHLAEAQRLIQQHSAKLEAELQALEELAGGAEVTGRTKELASAMGKLVRKPYDKSAPEGKRGYRSVSDLNDLTGMRVVAGSINEVRSTVDKLKSKYKIIEEDDYITTPNGAYRSYHLIVETNDGRKMEVQVRTANQNTHADWMHDIYKPQTSEQAKWMKSHGSAVSSYAKDMGNFYFAKDSGKGDAKKPPCPEVLSHTFGCL